MSRYIAVASKIRIASKSTSNVVGKMIVLIPWKMENGMQNCAATARIVLSHGGYLNRLNRLTEHPSRCMVHHYMLEEPRMCWPIFQKRG